MEGVSCFLRNTTSNAKKNVSLINGSLIINYPYVSGNIHLKESTEFYLYLGAKGEDQDKTNEYINQASGGWNFGGSGGVDKYDYNRGPPDSGAGGGGAVDLRLDYVDINDPNINNSSLEKSLMSRIIVAGSGGGSVSENNKLGFPGGTLSAINNGIYMFGGTQTEGLLGKGQKGINSEKNQGGAGGCGSGYRGAFHKFKESMTGVGLFEVTGSGGSSYISGHPGCISPHYPNNTIANETTPFHESKFYFTNTDMKAGNETMPDPFSDGYIFGHVGHGVCRITLLFNVFCQSNLLCQPHDISIMFSFLFVSLLSD